MALQMEHIDMAAWQEHMDKNNMDQPMLGHLILQIVDINKQIVLLVIGIFHQQETIAEMIQVVRLEEDTIELV